MKLTLIFLFSFVSINLFGQNETLPQFRGGQDSLVKFIAKNIKYPPEARENCISGKVYVKFLISADGTIDSINVIRSVHKSVDDEAIRLVKLTNGYWTPGKINDSSVSASFNLPFNFSLKDTNCKDKTYYYNKALEYLSDNKLKKAQINFEQAIKMDASYVDALYHCALVYIQLNNTSEACRYLKQLKKNGSTAGDKLLDQYCKD